MDTWTDVAWLNYYILKKRDKYLLITNQFTI